MIPAAIGGSNLLWVIVGIVVFVAFFVASRLIARFAADQLKAHNVRADMIVVGRRVVYVLVIVVGIFAAFGFALQSANVTLLGILLATLVAALGVQDLLKDYVSGYYVLLERHIRVGDHISLEDSSGTVTDVRLRVTLMKSDDGDLVVVPNSELFNHSVTVRNRKPEEAKPAPPA
ncbi:MAG: mechanosensitive ion channel [Chloroflexi bacterium]|nr:MAG: mechanosensitive ion channel [Chloroflexota bacterium]TMC73161.1 MAG: mechanosensitive ion channel [Chloroflexota bacterium]